MASYHLRSMHNFSIYNDRFHKTTLTRCKIAAGICETQRETVRSLAAQTDTLLCHKLCYLLLLPPLSQSCNPAPCCPNMGHLSALRPIRRVDASLLEMPWARARPEVSVRGATHWLVARGKGFRQKEGEDIKNTNN